MAKRFTDDLIDVTINGYDKFKGRKDVGSPTWFKLSNDFLSDPEFYSFTFSEKCAWIWGLVAVVQEAISSRFDQLRAREARGWIAQKDRRERFK